LLLRVAALVADRDLGACSVKKAVLRLVEVFVEKCEDDALLVTKFVPALMEPVLGDYAASVPDARWAHLMGLQQFVNSLACKNPLQHW